MSEQVGWRGFFKTLREEAPHYATLLPQLPRLLHQRLHENQTMNLDITLQQLLVQQKRRNTLLTIIMAILLVQAAWILLV